MGNVIRMALYDSIGQGYAALRRPDPRIAAAINTALGDAVSVANIGAGAGSYEPRDRDVIAIEPSQTMIDQRPAGTAPCIQGIAEDLPLKSSSVDAAMTVLSAHHWTDMERGLREMARIARKRVVMLTWVPDATPFWLTTNYFPEILAYDRTIFPDTDTLTAMLARVFTDVRLEPVPVPHDCIDGFLGAYWRRPEAYLKINVRNAISSFARTDVEPGLTRLRDDLNSGRWAECHRALLQLDSLDMGYRLVRCGIDVAKKC